ncbi:glycosyltransferase family 9 protein [Dictyobacter kobayashii]|uniref:Glycosyl transferase family 9 n=1 Tax=Dictyobacter kobayashii TaxID=2014872 RepID=A0A402AGR4_9CHLR|nr:glycosyltransferase family 9 protein [Dictyobacter kobayashii]GCE18318.1 hypothetical protein KDK_21180 [Dictyobacter kobayashii]
METEDLAFMSELARDPQRAISLSEQMSLQANQQALQQATNVIILLGGKAGRLGECVVGTALLEGTLQLLRSQHKAGTPVQIFIDQSSGDLFDIRSYQQAYWPEISIQLLATPLNVEDLIPVLSETAVNKRALVLDFHGARDGMPARTQITTAVGTLDILENLFRVSIRYYALRGPERRYADFLCDLFALPSSALPGTEIQPRIRLTQEDEIRYQQLQREMHFDPDSILIICFFQSVVLAKCYELWDEVMQLLCEYAAQHLPAQKLSFVLTCGPDDNLPAGFKKADMVEWLQDFRGVQNNASVHIYSTLTLRDLAILSSHARLALSDDTGPGHITGALQIPTIVPFLPGNIYAQFIWSSTPWHHGVTLNPNPYTNQQIEFAVIWGKTDIIDSIPATELYQEAVRYLQKDK